MSTLKVSSCYYARHGDLILFEEGWLIGEDDSVCQPFDVLQRLKTFEIISSLIKQSPPSANTVAVDLFAVEIRCGREEFFTKGIARSFLLTQVFVEDSLSMILTGSSTPVEAGVIYGEMVKVGFEVLL